ncbi:MAG TPA: serine--tRNA ligase [Gemmatimonadales bacterium]|nr:serine--tRNA ligase [Gemmatimonadales bacterium]
MLDLKRLRQDPEAGHAGLARRLDPSLGPQLDTVLALDRRWRDELARLESLTAERNAASEEVARRKRNREPADDLLSRLKASGEEERALKARVRELEAERDAVLLVLPNIPLAQVPAGDASANTVVRTWGAPCHLGFAPRPHWELAAALDILDLAAGAKIAGSGFPLFRGLGARLVRGLGAFMLDLHTADHGYVEVSPPLLANRASLVGTGQLPKFADELYTVPSDDLFLISTAEVPVTNIHRDDILDGARLPIAYVACTPCFRREAGAHGKDTRGLIRVHQFDKVELVRFCRPEESEAEHQRITAHAEAVLRRLGLHYRVVDLAAGDLGHASAHTYDLELWAPGVGAWLEVSSASTFTDYQARRSNIRYRPEPGGRPEFVHTLNASGVAFPRLIIALLETGQQADGSVRLPDALVPYVGVDRIERRG